MQAILLRHPVPPGEVFSDDTPRYHRINASPMPKRLTFPLRSPSRGLRLAVSVSGSSWPRGNEAPRYHRINFSPRPDDLKDLTRSLGQTVPGLCYSPSRARNTMYIIIFWMRSRFAQEWGSE
jgi:hypothetical protein